MERLIQVTADGSHTIAVPAMNVTYHSRHGAIRESRHVFIEAGWRTQQLLHPRVDVFEMGLGTGLNALLTWQEAIAQQQPVYYQAVELYPLTATEAHTLNYAGLLGPGMAQQLEALHGCPWEQDVLLHPLFTLHKTQTPLLEYLNSPVRRQFHLVYFDAFAPAAQPALWTTSVFEKLYARLFPGGALVTYCSKGDVRRSLLAAGFMVEKLPGPPGKREMLRARKPGPAS